MPDTYMMFNDEDNTAYMFSSGVPGEGFQDGQAEGDEMEEIIEVVDADIDKTIGKRKLRVGSAVSWEFRDSSHGEAYRRGSTMVTMGLAQDRANRDTSVYPGSGPSRLEVNPYFLPALY
jgi:hypothetical protein